MEIWKFSEFACYLAGLLGFLAGSLLIFGFWPMGQEGMTTLPHAAAADLVAPIYGVVFGFVCRRLYAFFVRSTERWMSGLSRTPGKRV